MHSFSYCNRLCICVKYYVRITAEVSTHVIQNNLRTPQLVGFAHQLGCKKQVITSRGRTHTLRIAFIPCKYFKNVDLLYTSETTIEWWDSNKRMIFPQGALALCIQDLVIIVIEHPKLWLFDYNFYHTCTCVIIYHFNAIMIIIIMNKIIL